MASLSTTYRIRFCAGLLTATLLLFVTLPGSLPAPKGGGSQTKRRPTVLVSETTIQLEKTERDASASVSIATVADQAQHAPATIVHRSLISTASRLSSDSKPSLAPSRASPVSGLQAMHVARSARCHFDWLLIA